MDTETQMIEQIEQVLGNVTRLNYSLEKIMELVTQHEHYILVLDSLLPSVFERMAEIAGTSVEDEVKHFQEKIQEINSEIEKRQEEFLKENQDEFPEELDLDA